MSQEDATIDRFYPQRGASMEPHSDGSHVRFAAVEPLQRRAERLEEETHELKKLLSQEEATREGAEEEAEELTSKVLDLEHECREASASETAAIDRAGKAEAALRDLEEDLAGLAERGGASPGDLAAASAKAHNALLTRDAASCVGDDS